MDSGTVGTDGQVTPKKNMLGFLSHLWRHISPWQRDAFQEFGLPKTHQAFVGQHRGVNGKKSKLPFATGSAGDTGRDRPQPQPRVPHHHPGTPSTAPCPDWGPQFAQAPWTTAAPSPASLAIRPPRQPGVCSLVRGQQDHAGCPPASTGDPAGPRPASAAGEVRSSRDPRGEEGWGHGGPVLSPTCLCFLKGCVSKGARGIPLLPPVPTRQGK